MATLSRAASLSRRDRDHFCKPREAAEPRDFDQDDVKFLRSYATVHGPIVDRLLKLSALRSSERVLSRQPMPADIAMAEAGGRRGIGPHSH